MSDLLGPDAAAHRAVVRAFGEHFTRAGYGEVVTPVLESLEVFLRLGEGTDVVSKEMYVFTDRDGSEVALRPETTASVARAFCEHHPNEPWKVWYFSQHFRHEKPQKGRLRQHHQVGAEVLGSADPDLDTELIVLLWDFFSRVLGLTGLRLEVNSIGEPTTRTAYAAQLGEFLHSVADRLDPVDAAKIDTHPLRVLDTKNERSRAALAGAPTLAAAMGADERERFARVSAGLDAAGVPWTLNPHLVRGLDYYTHTVFEIVSTSIDAAQSTIGAGGRYDGLVAALGGNDTPGVGFGAGVERILLALAAEGLPVPGEQPAPGVFVVGFGGDQSDVRDLCLELVRAGIPARRAYDQRSGRAQMKAADRSDAAVALLIGDDERAAGTVTVRDLRGDLPQTSIDRARLIDHVRTLL
jgi:histidyl-tRNA synthetase